MAEGESGFRPGQRVHIAGNPLRTGTVRYVGPVEGYSGEWVGVDWDDGEGKHDGSINGVRYFSTSIGEKSGSCVRAKNLSPGISLVEALHLRYRVNSTKEEEDEMYVFSASKRKVTIELVGKDKARERLKLEGLVGASVACLGVSSIGSPHEINALVPNLKELDLTGNLLSRWQDIDSICKAIPSLEAINLTSNSMERDLPDSLSFKSIRIFVLNNCGITWEQVEILKPSLPAVEELHLMGNKIRSITLGPSVACGCIVQGFDSLRLLNLEDNCISSWDEIAKLCYLRSLEQLHLNKNNLKVIFYPTNKYHGLEPASNGSMQNKFFLPFEKLQCLLLGSNEIEDLASVDSLNLFPSLMDIRLSENPITDPANGGVPRFVLIARLAKAKILNGSEISPRERKESEIRYVRHVMAKMQSYNPEEIKKLNPRFSELKALHGIDDEKLSTRPAGSHSMGSSLLSVTLICVGSLGEKLPLTKKLPPSTTVGKLKILCESFFKLKGMKLRLFLQEEGSPLPQLLDDDMALLVDTGIGTGATILVDEDV